MTDTPASTAVVERLRTEFGETLQAVVTYSADGYTVHHATDEIRADYPPEDMDAIYDDVMLEEANQPFQEELFGAMGAVRGKIRLFEAGTVAHFWPTDGEEGLFVSFTAEADPGVRSLLAVAERYYG